MAPMVPLAIASVMGGFILLLFAILLVVTLLCSQMGKAVLQTPLQYALAVNLPVRVPNSLNGFALWNAILLVFMVVMYGYPIGQFFALKSSVPVYEVTRHTRAAGVPCWRAAKVPSDSIIRGRELAGFRASCSLDRETSDQIQRDSRCFGSGQRGDDQRLPCSGIWPSRSIICESSYGCDDRGLYP
jgi:hypothetical protein